MGSARIPPLLLSPERVQYTSLRRKRRARGGRAKRGWKPKARERAVQKRACRCSCSCSCTRNGW